MNYFILSIVLYILGWMSVSAMQIIDLSSMPEWSMKKRVIIIPIAFISIWWAIPFIFASGMIYQHIKDKREPV